jgi:hypothetical protein
LVGRILKTHPDRPSASNTNRTTGCSTEEFHMIYVSRTGDSERVRPPRALPATPPDRGAALRRVAVALAIVAVIASVLGAVVILGVGGGPTA